MRRTDVSQRAHRASSSDLRTWRIAVGDEASVDALAARFVADGLRTGLEVRGARAMDTTNAWCAIPEGNRVEITAG